MPRWGAGNGLCTEIVDESVHNGTAVVFGMMTDAEPFGSEPSSTTVYVCAIGILALACMLMFALGRGHRSR